MKRPQAVAALHRALDLSQQLVRVADAGDVPQTVSLDAERLLLLQSVRQALQPMDEPHQAVLREIAVLNDQAIGLIEHHRRSKGRALDMAAVGRKAVAAYSGIRLQR
jgi:hypothetical protein